MNDNVNHPAHYTAGGIECIDALKAATVDLVGLEAVCTANAIKYLWRWKHKNGVEDLNKAMWYIKRLIKEVEHPNVVFSDEGLSGVGLGREQIVDVNTEQGNRIKFVEFPDDYPTEPEKRETCRERLQRERPNKIDGDCDGGCQGCPATYGYKTNRRLCREWSSTFESSDEMCRACWDQEVLE